MAIFLVKIFLSIAIIWHKGHLIRGDKLSNSFAEHGEFPYQVSIHYRNALGTMEHICGGSIIDKYHVLTAGHCIFRRNIKEMSIIGGVRDLFVLNDPNRVLLSVEKAYMHEKFNNVFFINDIALLKVTPSFPTLNPYVKPIELHDKTPEVYDHACVATGWGTSVTKPKFIRPNLDGLLHKETMPHYDWENCEGIYLGFFKGFIKPGMICVSSPSLRKKFCPSDGGGPLNCRGKLAGIYSFVHRYLPDVFTDVSYYRKWIVKTLERSYKEHKLSGTCPLINFYDGREAVECNSYSNISKRV